MTRVKNVTIIECIVASDYRRKFRTIRFVQSGCAWTINAAIPATIGVAKEVPLFRPYEVGEVIEATMLSTPGATTSGLMRPEN